MRRTQAANFTNQRGIPSSSSTADRLPCSFGQLLFANCLFAICRLPATSCLTSPIASCWFALRHLKFNLGIPYSGIIYLAVRCSPMRLVIAVFALLLSSHGLAQQCATTVLASFYDQLTKDEIETLKAGDLEIKIDGKKLPVLSASRDFNNRLVILLQTEGSAKNDKLSDLV